MKRLLLLTAVLALISCAKKDEPAEGDTTFVRAPAGDSTTLCVVDTTKVTGKKGKAHADTTCP